MKNMFNFIQKMMITIRCFAHYFGAQNSHTPTVPIPLLIHP